MSWGEWVVGWLVLAVQVGAAAVAGNGLRRRLAPQTTGTPTAPVATAVCAVSLVVLTSLALGTIGLFTAWAVPLVLVASAVALDPDRRPWRAPAARASPRAAAVAEPDGADGEGDPGSSRTARAPTPGPARQRGPLHPVGGLGRDGRPRCGVDRPGHRGVPPGPHRRRQPHVPPALRRPVRAAGLDDGHRPHRHRRLGRLLPGQRRAGAGLDDAALRPRRRRPPDEPRVARHWRSWRRGPSGP